MKKQDISRNLFTVFNYTFFIILAFTCIFPILHILALSFSSTTASMAGEVLVLPVDFNLKSYEYLLTKPNLLEAFNISIIRTLVGTAVNMTLAVLAAYPLSKEAGEFRWRTRYVWFFVLTMLFNGGLIPWYMTIKSLKLINSIWALILPTAVSVYSIILLLNFFRGLPKEMTESAFIDGAGHWMILRKLFIPLSAPAIATLVLFNSVGHWNAWFDGLILMSSPKKYPLQSYLQTILFVPQLGNMTKEDAERMKLISDKTVKSAQIFVATVPILLIYPFLQKYFIKGLVLGSVKG